MIRLADVLLMLAESLNENGKTAPALTYLNQVRVRAGVATYADGNQTDTHARIALERRLELPFEGHRWFKPCADREGTGGVAEVRHETAHDALADSISSGSVD